MTSEPSDTTNSQIAKLPSTSLLDLSEQELQTSSSSSSVKPEEGDEPIGDLFHSYGTRSSRVLWLVHELGLKVNLKITVLSRGDHKRPEYLKVNPTGKVPAFIDKKNELLLFESTAICYYLLDKYDISNRLYGERGSNERAQLYKYGAFVASTIDDTVVPLFLHKILLPEKIRNPQIVAEHTKKFEESIIPVLERDLGDQNYFNGDEFTAVDIFVGYCLNIADHAGLLENRPKLKEYVNRIKLRPAFEKAHRDPSRTYM